MVLNLRQVRSWQSKLHDFASRLGKTDRFAKTHFDFEAKQPTIAHSLLNSTSLLGVPYVIAITSAVLRSGIARDAALFVDSPSDFKARKEFSRSGRLPQILAKCVSVRKSKSLNNADLIRVIGESRYVLRFVYRLRIIVRFSVYVRFQATPPAQILVGKGACNGNEEPGERGLGSRVSTGSERDNAIGSFGNSKQLHGVTATLPPPTQQLETTAKRRKATADQQPTSIL